VAMFVSGLLSLALKLTPMGDWLFGGEGGLLPGWWEYPTVVLVTTLAWLAATYLTPPENDGVLEAFCLKVRPGGPGWRGVEARARARGVELGSGGQWSVPSGIMAMLLGSVLIYALMFATGYWIYGDTPWALGMSAVALAAGTALVVMWNRIRATIS